MQKDEKRQRREWKSPVLTILDSQCDSIEALTGFVVDGPTFSDS